ncbi:MAG: hypothetical protein Q4D62_08280 [Planctomycetia bacterium]|nr:hypothetical protein [Planctomycetia bacterium]
MLFTTRSTEAQIQQGMRILHIADRPRRSESWLAAALGEVQDVEFHFQEVYGTIEGMRILQKEKFDVLLVQHAPPRLDALRFASGCRTGGIQEPILILGMMPHCEMYSLCCEANIDDYVYVPGTTASDLLWMMTRAIRRNILIRENRDWQHKWEQLLQRESEELAKAVFHDNQILENIPDSFPPRNRLPQEFAPTYEALLHKYIPLEAGDLSGEIREFCKKLAQNRISAKQVMLLHLQAMDNLIVRLGGQNIRYLRQRAELLRTEILSLLLENYRI